jgi:hypothetical protein
MVRRDVVAGFLQATFNGSPERRIIIDDVNNHPARHFL